MLLSTARILWSCYSCEHRVVVILRLLASPAIFSSCPCSVTSLQLSATSDTVKFPFPSARNSVRVSAALTHDPDCSFHHKEIAPATHRPTSSNKLMAHGNQAFANPCQLFSACPRTELHCNVMWLSLHPFLLERPET